MVCYVFALCRGQRRHRQQRVQLEHQKTQNYSRWDSSLLYTFLKFDWYIFSVSDINNWKPAIKLRFLCQDKAGIAQNPWKDQHVLFWRSWICPLICHRQWHQTHTHISFYVIKISSQSGIELTVDCAAGDPFLWNFSWHHQTCSKHCHSC